MFWLGVAYDPPPIRPGRPFLGHRHWLRVLFLWFPHPPPTIDFQLLFADCWVLNNPLAHLIVMCPPSTSSSSAADSNGQIGRASLGGSWEDNPLKRGMSKFQILYALHAGCSSKIRIIIQLNYGSKGPDSTYIEHWGQLIILPHMMCVGPKTVRHLLGSTCSYPSEKLPSNCST